jgi:hypothetical protein
MVWDMMFRPARPMGTGGPNDLAGFYTVSSKALGWSASGLRYRR